MMKLLNIPDFSDIKQDHTFGCPLFLIITYKVLNPPPPTNPKWDPCFRLMFFVRRSPFRVGSVAVVLNIISG